MDRFLQLTCFARAVETGSFSATARELAIGQPSVSRYIAGLEESLGTRLLHRSTRSLTLTPEGEHYYAEVRRALDALAEADSNVRGQDKPSGLLRVSCPSSLGLGLLLPRLRAFLAAYPEIELDLQIIDRFVDLVEEGVDMAIRIGALRDSTLRARRIGTSERICVASRSYLERRGEPKVPEDLLNHDCIIYTLLTSGNTWTFKDRDVTVGGHLRINTTDAIQLAVLDGLGIAHGPLWLYEGGIRDGRVRVVLKDHIGPPAPIHLVYSAKRLLPRRAIVFMEYIAEEFARIPAVNEGALARLCGHQEVRETASTRPPAPHSRPKRRRSHAR